MKKYGIYDKYNQEICMVSSDLNKLEKYVKEQNEDEGCEQYCIKEVFEVEFVTRTLAQALVDEMIYSTENELNGSEIVLEPTYEQLNELDEKISLILKDWIKKHNFKTGHIRA